MMEFSAMKFDAKFHQTDENNIVSIGINLFNSFPAYSKTLVRLTHNELST